MKNLASLIIIFWMAVGLFVGVGGLTKLNSDESAALIEKNKDDLSKKELNVMVEGVKVSNQYEFDLLTEQLGVEHYFKWTILLPQFTALLITAMGFGLLGSIIGLIKEIVVAKKPVEDCTYVSSPFLGILTGLVVLGVTYLLPTLLTKGGSEIRPLTLMFLCLFCGIFMEKFYTRLEASFNKLFTGK